MVVVIVLLVVAVVGVLVVIVVVAGVVVNPYCVARQLIRGFCFKLEHNALPVYNGIPSTCVYKHFWPLFGSDLHASESISRNVKYVKVMRHL